MASAYKVPRTLWTNWSFKEGIIVQSVGDVEDSFDIEAMTRIEQEHKKRFQKLRRCTRRRLPPCLVSGRRCLQPLRILHLP
jgi:hypothetical protein